MSASYLYGAFNGLSIYLAVSQLWALSDIEIFCTLLIIRQPAREQKVTNKGVALNILCLSLKNRNQISMAKALAQSQHRAR